MGARLGPAARGYWPTRGYIKEVKRLSMRTDWLVVKTYPIFRLIGFVENQRSATLA